MKVANHIPLRRIIGVILLISGMSLTILFASTPPASAQDEWDVDEVERQLCQEEIETLRYNTLLPTERVCPRDTDICHTRERTPVDFLGRYLSTRYGEDVPQEHKKCLNEFLTELFSQDTD